MKNNKSVLKIFALFVVLTSVFVLNINKVSAVSVSCTNITSTLRLGSRNKSEITKLQNFLQSQGYMSESTGYFGKVTENALKTFQKKEGIPSLGIVGPLTKSKITNITCLPVAQKDTIITPVVSNPIPVVSATVNKETSLPYTSSSFNDWIAVWGKLSTSTENTLQLKASQDTNGAQAVLVNSNSWTNYRVNYSALVGQGNIILISRYVDENNFLACNFSGKYIEIIQKLNGVSNVLEYVTLSDVPYTQYFNDQLNVSMTVNKKTVGCLLVGNEDNVISTKVSDTLLKGGIGVQTWANSVGVARIDLKSVKVLPL